MNDSPGWATPGPSPSDDRRPGAPAGTPDPDAAQPPARAPGTGDRKWAASQPPPGQWSNPGTEGTPAPGQTPQPPAAVPQQGTGWGGQGGRYGYPGGPAPWGPPPAAKPGVIPLRPLGLGEILDGAVATMRTHWRSVLPISLVVAALVQLVTLLLQKFVFAEIVTTPTDEIDAEAMLEALGGTMLLSVVSTFIQLVGTILATAMLTVIFSKAVLGHRSSISGAWREARPRLLRLCGLTLLLGLGAGLLALLLMLPGLLSGNPALIVLGGLVSLPLICWLWVRFSLASPVLMLEKSSIFTALGRSSKLVQGSWWRIFGITVLTGVITAFVSSVIVLPLTFLGQNLFGDGLSGFAEGSSGSRSWGALIVTAIGLVIALTITLPMQGGVTVLLYVDQRIRREALDLELARAAGLGGYGTATAAPPSAGPVTGG